MPFRDEFHIRNIGLTHFRQDVFFTPQWHWPPVVFIVYRFIVAGYIVGWLMYVAATFEAIRGQAFTLYEWPVYLTNWSYFMLAAHLLISLTVTCIHTAEQGYPCCEREHVLEVDWMESEDAQSAFTSTEVDDEEVMIREPHTLPWYMKLSWVLFNIAAIAAFMVSAVYWTVLFPLVQSQSGSFDSKRFLIDFNLHGVNTIVILLEIFICAIPVRIFHLVYPFIFGLAYLIFSVIFWAYDNTRVIYPEVLDWNKPGTTIIAVLVIALVGVPLLQTVFYCLYRARVALFRAVYRHR